jgi:predicted 3-demethylubiquinone-9 3-methyltransferase (glyoxalase superfamily)
MQKIIPCLWFDNQAEEAMHFYTSIFQQAKIGNVTRYGEAGPGPTGSVLVASFELLGQEFTALNGGPAPFSFTPALSFLVNCETAAEVDRLWEKLASGGKVLMELGTYPFSEKFGWVEDRFGVSWQLNLSSKQKIVPSFLFVGEQYGKAEEAMHFYTSLFRHGSNKGI